ncbi:MAG: response regulator transcription factor [Acidimicrobiales bacterium]
MAHSTKSLVFVVDDEQGVRDLICDALSIAGFDTMAAKDGESALVALRGAKPDLLILDVNMPFLNGFELLAQIRDKGNLTPALMLSARGDRSDVVQGLRLGADDYVTKPFGLEELLLRVNAILRRTQLLDAESTVSCGPVTLDGSQHEVYLHETLVELSPTEFRLLEYLMMNQNRVVSKSQILDEVWGIDFESNTSIVDTYISYLRRKLHRDGFEGITTVRGVGYRILDTTGRL